MARENRLDEKSAGWKICRRALHPLFALVAGVCLLALVGWLEEVTPWLHGCTTWIGIIFGLERGWSLWSERPLSRERHRLTLRAVLAVAVLVVSVALFFQAPAYGGHGSSAAHFFVLLSALISGITLGISHQKRFTARAFHPGLVLILSFFAVILIGTLLLKMPRCTVPGQTCSWMDALFTSTSAVCVTGLTVQNTATFFTTTGQTVILLLIQVGGLGIMTLTFFAAVVLFEGLSLHDRLLLGKMIQENRLARVGLTLKFIVIMTFSVEAIGAVVLFCGMDGLPDFSERAFHAVFHSISAFCNAGFSTLPDNLASGVILGNWVWQVMIMMLIVVGGLGALVNEDLTLWSIAKIKRRISKEGPHPRLRVHTRLVLVVTTVLIVVGAGMIYGSEFLLINGPQNGGKILTSFFHSVTARTAGFNSVPMSQIGLLTAQFLIILMVIGGSPGGTAGGLRTTVVAVGLAHLWSQLRMGRRGMVFFNRTIPAEAGSQALGLIFLTGIWLTVNFIALQLLEAGSGVSETHLLFELISAFATVGLSLDLTPSLSDGAKTLLIVNMFVGRIGLLTVMATLIKPDSRPASGKPEEKILLT
jgi:Trk-type K+ transport system membrane component